MTPSRNDPLPEGHKWCSVHECTHPVDDFAWRDREKGTRQSRCRAAQSVLNAANYQANHTERIAAATSRKQEVTSSLWAQLEALQETQSCDDCGKPGETGLLATMPDGLPTPAEAIRRQLAGIDLANLVAQATWRCRSCAGDFPPRSPRPTGLRASVIAAITSGGEWTIDDLSAHLTCLGVPHHHQSLRNRLAKLADEGVIQRFDRGVYRMFPTAQGGPEGAS